MKRCKYHDKNLYHISIGLPQLIHFSSLAIGDAYVNQFDIRIKFTETKL